MPAEDKPTREISPIQVANRLLRWTILPDGGARMDQLAVYKVDRMVAILMHIRDRAGRDYSPAEIAAMPKDVLQS